MHVHHVLEYVHSSCKLRARLTVVLRILTMHNTTELLSREYEYAYIVVLSLLWIDTQGIPMHTYMMDVRCGLLYLHGRTALHGCAHILCIEYRVMHTTSS